MGAVFKMPLSKERIDRSPRYEIRPGEGQVLKFSRSGSQRKISKTKILNISDTGMAFTVDGRAIPHLGEIIKVDFNLEGRVIRYGRVVRLESPPDSLIPLDISVAIEFLPERNPENLRLVLGIKKSLVPKDPMVAKNTFLDANVQQLLLVSGFILVCLMMGLVSH